MELINKFYVSELYSRYLSNYYYYFYCRIKKLHKYIYKGLKLAF
ncbi:hypothetical protein J2Z76_002288 [Sedimentibacter acidaminivorans]|uniref:Uncharacterized protein n=1 Tax=Sedimentibacter acidaminivorans TaxID=913099 RepID=A0ABS4GFF1_9FIRM|nr:hypothetical protein [Sedimentibacter acidaminivorans]